MPETSANNNLKLKNTLQIDGIDYDIAAAYSDEAGKVTHGLNIKKAGYDTNTTITTNFDGSTPGQEICYVSADEGGRFAKPVYVDNSLLSDNIPDESIVNHGQLLNEIALLQGTPVYTWSTEYDNQLHTLVSASPENQIYNLMTIVGNVKDFSILERLLGTPWKASETQSTAYYGLKFTIANNIAQISSYVPCGYPDVIIPYACYPMYTDGGEDYNHINRTSSYVIEHISDNAFANQTTISTVLIADNIKDIGSCAFKGCVNLKLINIPKSVVSFGDDVFADCGANLLIRYAGTEEDWNKISNSAQAVNIKKEFLTESSVISSNGIIDFRILLEKPFIYACVENENSSNINSDCALFLKLPGDFTITRLSGSAFSLASTVNNTKYFTYESLYKLLAKLNKRLGALGDKNSLKLTELEDDASDNFNPAGIPTVQSLKSLIDQLKSDLLDLTAEVTNELEHSQNNQIFAANSRIDYLEDKVVKLKPVLDAFVDDIEYPDIIEWTE